MTKQQNSTTESRATTYEQLTEALGDLQSNYELPEAARDFVKRTAAAAKDRSADVRANANKVTDAIEQVLASAVSGMADANRKLVDAAYGEFAATLVVIDKLAGAKSFGEAYHLYVDYLRQQSEVSVARAKSVAGFVSAKATEGFNTLRDGIAKVVPVRPQTV